MLLAAPVGAPEVWFERLHHRVGLPLWAGALLLGVVPTILLLPVSYYLSGLWNEFLSSGIIFSSPLLALVIMFAHFSVRYVRRRLMVLAEYADLIREDGLLTDLKELYRLRGVAVTYLLLMGTVQTIFIFFVLPGRYSLAQKLGISLPFLFWNVFLCTFFWVWFYSIYKIYRMGKLPLKLRPFTEDRTLGLKPFGRTSLQLTGVYVAFLASIFVTTVPLSEYSPLVIALAISLLLLGLVIFFLPLLTLHSKLVEAKQQALQWISPQYVALVQKLRKDGLENSDEKLYHALAAIDKIQRDINQIHSWPFDVGIVTRLAAIIFSVVAILLASFVRAILRF